MKKILKKAFMLPLVIIAALALVIFLVKSRSTVQHEDIAYPAKTVEVITVKKLPYRASAIGYGNVEPARVLKAKAEVGGKIAYVHPGLKKGGSLPKGATVIRIEPTTFEFSLNQSRAGLVSTESSLKQLEVEEESTRRSLAIARKNLDVGLQELERIKSIWNKRLVAKSEVDNEEQKVLQLRASVQDLEGRLEAYSSRKASTKAQIKQSATQVEERKDTLGRTEVTLPFDARIGEVKVEAGEYIALGGQLFEALGVDAVEINAQLPIRHVRPLAGNMSVGSKGSRDLQTPENLSSALAEWGLEVHVRLVGDTHAAVWKGELLRISESIDPTRDTIGLVVRVEKPYAGVIPGKRPPLIKGMYTSVEFLTKPADGLVIPRNAVHEGRVYVVDENDHLSIRPVTLRQVQGQLAIVESGLQPGERIVITDLVPVIEGIPLKPVEAGDIEQKLALLALGKDPIALDTATTADNALEKPEVKTE